MTSKFPTIAMFAFNLQIISYYIIFKWLGVVPGSNFARSPCWCYWATDLKSSVWDGLKWHGIDIKFPENCSTGPKLHSQKSWWSYKPVLFLRKESRLKVTMDLLKRKGNQSPEDVSGIRSWKVVYFEFSAENVQCPTQYWSTYISRMLDLRFSQRWLWSDMSFGI
jgi:hypothetical protein